MTEPVSILLVRAAERELSAAFMRGEFDQALRAYVAGYARARLDAGSLGHHEAGPQRERFCYELARRWAALPEAHRLGSVTAYLHDGLSLRELPAEFRQALVVPLRPSRPKPIELSAQPNLRRSALLELVLRTRGGAETEVTTGRMGGCDNGRIT
jgi:hypothetical protein